MVLHPFGWSEDYQDQVTKMVEVAVAGAEAMRGVDGMNYQERVA